MPVYVDSMRAKFGRMVMCHMIATSFDELHSMADKIGIRRKWFQGDHYDIALSKRALAIRYGAIEISWRQCGALSYFQRLGLEMGDPITAIERMLEHKARGVAQSGSASALGAEGRLFESDHPDH